MHLRRFERRWSDVIGRAMIPAGVLGGVADDLEAGRLVDEECAAGPWYMAWIIRLSVWLAWWGPLLRRGRTFGGLGVDEREASLERLLKSRVYFIRMMGLLLKLTVCSALLGDRRVLARIDAYGLGGARAPLTLPARGDVEPTTGSSPEP